MNQRHLTRRQLLGAASTAATAALVTACSPFGGRETGGGSGGGGGGDTKTIRFITPADLGLERELYTGFLRDFEKENAGTKVSVTFEAWDDYMTKLPTLLAGGAIPDLIHQHMSIVQDYGQRGALMDLAPLMKRDGIDREAFVPALFDAFADGEKVYGIPKDCAAWGVYYNKAKFDEAGVNYPADDWTMEQFQSTVRQLTVDKAGRSPGDAGFDAKNIKQWGLNWLAPTPTESENSRGFVRAFGGDWYDEAYKSTLIDQDPAKAQFEMFRKMRCVDGSTPSPSQELGQGDPFRAGLTAMTVAFHNADFFLREEKAKFDWGVTYLPSGPGGQFVPVGCSGWAIAADAKNPDGAWTLIKHLTSPAVQKKIASQKRWGPSVVEAIESLVRTDPKDGFVKVHVDPMRGKSDREVITFKFPANQSRIQQAYAANFDPIWTTCSTSDVAGAAQKTKQAVDSILAS